MRFASVPVLLLAALTACGCASRLESLKTGLPPPDQVWLVEMLAQRLEVGGPLLAAQPLPSGTPETEEHRAAQLATIMEQAARSGLPPMPVKVFYEAQIDALNAYELILRDQHRQEAPPSAASTSDFAVLEAIDAQILATLARIGTIPTGREIHRLATRTLRHRGIPKRPVLIAAAPFRHVPSQAPGLP